MTRPTKTRILTDAELLACGINPRTLRPRKKALRILEWSFIAAAVLLAAHVIITAPSNVAGTLRTFDAITNITKGE